MIDSNINIKCLIRNINLDILSDKKSEYTKLYDYIINIFKCLNEYNHTKYNYPYGEIPSDLIFYGYTTDELLITYHQLNKKLYVNPKLFINDISDTFFSSNIFDSIDIILEMISYLFEIHFDKRVSISSLSAMSKLIKK